MSHVWVSASDGDLLRADQIRQINVVEGLRVVTISGSQFLVADIEGREEAMAVAKEFAAAIAEADTWHHAAGIAVERDGDGWTVRLSALRDAGRPDRAA